MKVVFRLAICLFSILAFECSSYAAFPGRNIQLQANSAPPDVSATAERPTVPTTPNKKKHKHYHNHEEQPEKYDLSIVSSALAVASLVALGFAVGTLSAPLAGVAVILAVVAFIAGAQALNRKQKLKGLAILGLIIGGVITIKFIAAIIPVLIGTK